MIARFKNEPRTIMPQSDDQPSQIIRTKNKMIQQERSCSGLMKLLVHFGFLFLLQCSLPGTTEARVHAYIDANGILHCAPVHGGERRTLGGISGKSTKSTILSKTDSISRSLNELIRTAGTEHGVDPFLIKAVIKAESNFDRKAVSAKGAQGLMQLMPGTARDLQVADPFDPQENIVGGAKYLRYLLDCYDGDIELSLAAYNAGPGNVKNKIPKIRETKLYVSKVLENYQSYQRNR